MKEYYPEREFNVSEAGDKARRAAKERLQRNQQRLRERLQAQQRNAARRTRPAQPRPTRPRPTGQGRKPTEENVKKLVEFIKARRLQTKRPLPHIQNDINTFCMKCPSFQMKGSTPICADDPGLKRACGG